MENIVNKMSRHRRRSFEHMVLNERVKTRAKQRRLVTCTDCVERGRQSPTGEMRFNLHLHPGFVARNSLISQRACGGISKDQKKKNPKITSAPPPNISLKARITLRSIPILPFHHLFIRRLDAMFSFPFMMDSWRFAQHMARQKPGDVQNHAPTPFLLPRKRKEASPNLSGVRSANTRPTPFPQTKKNTYWEPNTVITKQH